MLRAAIAAGTGLGSKVKPILESGALVPDELMIELIQERLGGPDATAGFVLDGFPRTMAQAEALDQMLHAIGHDLTVVFELQVDDTTCIERMLGRAREEGRSDDTPEVIGRRLEIYHEETEPIVEHYRAAGNLVGIHGGSPPDEVYAEIGDALEQVLQREAAS